MARRHPSSCVADRGRKRPGAWPWQRATRSRHRAVFWPMITDVRRGRSDETGWGNATGRWRRGRFEKCGDVVRVCLLQQVVPAYRIPVFNLLGSREGIDLSVLAGVSSSEDPPTNQLTGTEHFRLGMAPVRSLGPFLSQPAQLTAIWQGFDVIIYSWNSRFVELVPALLAARQLGVKTVVWGHGTSPTETRLRRTVRDRVGTLADACIVYGESVAERLRNSSRYTNKVFVARNAIDQSPIEAAAAKWVAQPEQLRRFRSDRVPAGAEIILFLSRLRPFKRGDLALEATRALVEEGRNVVLAVIGDGSDRARLEALAATTGISDRVLFLGSIYDESTIAAWALSAAVYLVPGPVGLSLLHALGYGLPVVTSAAPQSPEIEALQDERNGILFPLNDHSRMVDAIRRLLDNPTLRQEMSRAATDTVRGSGFTVENMVDGMLDAVRRASQNPAAL